MSLAKSFGLMVRETGQAMDRMGMKMMGNYAYKEKLCRHRRVMSVYDTAPILASGVFVAPNASVIGDVTIGSSSSVWYGAVVRGDVNSVSVGAMSNLQDRVLVSAGAASAADGNHPAVIGDRVTVGQGAILQACTLHDESAVGIGAQVLNGAVVEKHGVLAAGAVLAPGAVVKSGEIWAGVPATLVGKVESTTIDHYLSKCDEYSKLAAVHAAEHSKTLDILVAEQEARARRAQLSDDYASQMGIRTQLDEAGQARTARDSSSF